MARCIDGAFIGLYHWSEEEGRRWNAVLKQFTAEDWRTLIRAAHAIGLDILIIQEVFRNQMYHGRHRIETRGYHGKAFYPSQLYPDRMNLPDPDPLTTILTEADGLGMQVFLGVGLYAWFDFTPGSLTWHRQVMTELWTRYGQHPSLAGWYISEEVCGSITPARRRSFWPGANRRATDNYRHEIIAFFQGLRTHADSLNARLPLMLAPNCHRMLEAEKTWRSVLPHLGMLCPFGFNRMPPGDRPAAEVARWLADLCHDAGTQLWLDMEIFLFGPQRDLYPRPLEEILTEMAAYPEFAKIIAYQLPGLLNPPDARLTPGGPATVALYEAYRAYYQQQKSQT